MIFGTYGLANSEEISYKEARTTGNAYSCTFEVGERDSYKAQIKGNDFIAHNNSFPKLVFARVENTAYMWVDKNGGIDMDSTFYKFDFQSIKETMDLSYDFRWHNFMVFVEPEAHSPCKPINQAEIIIPQVSFSDRTAMIIQGLYVEKTEFKSLTYSVYLPPYAEYSEKRYYINAAMNSGYEDPYEFDVGFELKKDGQAIEITEYKSRPDTDFCEGDIHCKLFSSSANYEIYKVGVHSFAFIIDETYIVFKLATGSDMSENRIIEIVNSFKKVDHSILKDFEHM